MGDAARFFFQNGEIFVTGTKTASVEDHTGHYGDGIIDGARATRAPNGVFYFFRMEPHTDRTFYGVEKFQMGDRNEIYYLTSPAGGHFLSPNMKNRKKISVLTRSQYESALLNVTALNYPRESDAMYAYIRPRISTGPGVGVNAIGLPVNVDIVNKEWPDYFTGNGMFLGDEARASMSRASIDAGDIVFDSNAKTVGLYEKSVRAKQDALAIAGLGIAEPLLRSGSRIGELSGANLMILEDGKLVTPPLNDNVLDGITMRSITDMGARGDGPVVVREHIDLDRLISSRGAGATGTAAGVKLMTFLVIEESKAYQLWDCGQLSRAHFEVGMRRRRQVLDQPRNGISRGLISVLIFPLGTKESRPVIQGLARRYSDIVHGKNFDYMNWLTEVPARAPKEMIADAQYALFHRQEMERAMRAVRFNVSLRTMDWREGKQRLDQATARKNVVGLKNMA